MKLTPAEILAIKLGDNDAGADTIGGYLKELLARVWDEEEGFSGKRPFGNSGWQGDIILPLVDAKLVKGRKTIYDAGADNEYVEYDDVDYKAGEKIIANCIEYIFENYT